MNNLACTMGIILKHREARDWSDSAVAMDLLNQLGLDTMGEAKNPAPVADPMEAEVEKAEANAKVATETAKTLRAEFDAKGGPNGYGQTAAAQSDTVTASADTKVVLPPPAQSPSPLQATTGDAVDE